MNSSLDADLIGTEASTAATGQTAEAAPRAAAATFWEKRTVRHVEGVKVSFYRRSVVRQQPLHMHFYFHGALVRETTGCMTVADAERVARRRILELRDGCNGLGEVKATLARQRAAVATVGEILRALEGGDKVMTDNSLRTYKSALKRLAVVAAGAPGTEAAEDVEGLGLDVVLSKGNLERFYALGQGREGQGVNWINRLPCNGGLNSTIRNVRALFRPRLLELKYAGLKLPSLEDLRRLPKLPAAKGGFKPWPAGVYEAMHAAAEGLKESDYELWLINACLRFLGLRACELLAARREWITTSEDGRAWLNVEDQRGADAEDDEVSEFEVVKHGAARRLELNAVLKEALLPRRGFLVVPDEGVDRAAVIYRRHSEWLRQFIPDRVKSNHELRMYAGSLVAKEHGLEAACYFLGHTSLVTTQAFYWAWLKESPMIEARALAGAHG